MVDLYLERVRGKLKSIVESGMYDEAQVMAAIDDALDSFLVYRKDDDGVASTIKDFQDSNETLTKKIMECRKSISENYKNIYEHIIKDEI